MKGKRNLNLIDLVLSSVKVPGKKKKDVFPFKSKVDIFVEIFVCIAKDRMMKEEHRTDKEKKSI